MISLVPRSSYNIFSADSVYAQLIKCANFWKRVSESFFTGRDTLTQTPPHTHTLCYQGNQAPWLSGCVSVSLFYFLTHTHCKWAVAAANLVVIPWKWIHLKDSWLYTCTHAYTIFFQDERNSLIMFLCVCIYFFIHFTPVNDKTTPIVNI